MHQRSSCAPTSLGAPARKLYKSIGKQEVLITRGLTLSRHNVQPDDYYEANEDTKNGFFGLAQRRSLQIF